MKSPAESPVKPSPHNPSPTQAPSPEPRSNEQELDDASMWDVDDFTKTISNIKSKSRKLSRPDLLASVLSHYASKLLSELSSTSSGQFSGPPSPPESPTAAWLKKRPIVESLIAALPPEMNNKDMESAINCDILLTLLRAGLMVGADQACLRELGARVSRRLEQVASLSEVMIPAFGHTSGTLLDVSLVVRLVEGFSAAEEMVSGAAMARMAKLVDVYLAEAALEARLGAKEFEKLARALPPYARATDEGLYWAVDTFLKAHPSTTEDERKILCRLIDTGKLTSEASAHAIQNELLPVRCVMQVLFSEHTKLNRLLAHQDEIRQLREDVAHLRVQCHALQAHVDRLTSERTKKGGFFRWSTFFFGRADVAKVEDSDSGAERQTTLNSKKGRPIPPAHGSGTATPSKRCKSLS